ncbi:DNA polymerase III subunit gamma/tau [Pseudoscardovia suis]
MALALYRRYRPDTFDGVIGQQQVTEPLCRALDNNHLTHAYLFSGPRGCGKTSSARILARCVNCVKGPTSHPCGECESCRELAANGPGSIDVMEIDAASHNGVEDARELRERVTFGPTRDRYKIIILDEAHMITPQSFNALLKTVEEPPDNVMFIFATTEPDAVISTIRSRTHHYPFRLVPPEVMGPYLEKICQQEGITPAQGVLRLVMRAGGGSVRDTLSVLDQLMVGAENNEITYDSAVRLLGFTPDSLIGEAVDAVIESNGAKLYGIINKVVVGGYEPKKFVDDLLARVRDLTVLTLAGEQAEKVLSDDVRVEDGDELRRQASALGLAKLTWMAETINDTLEQMKGAISPRMRLELLAAKLLVPADQKAATGQPAHAAAGQQPAQAPVRPRYSQTQTAPAAPTAPQGGAGISNAAGLNAALSAMSAVQTEPAQTAASPTPMPAAAAPVPAATPAAATSQAQVDELWDKAVASLPDDAKVFLTREQVPDVNLKRDPRNPARARLNLTFIKPVAQQAFSMAMCGDSKVVDLARQAVHQFFGEGTVVAPARMAKDGEPSVPLSKLPAQQQQEARRAALYYSVQLRGGASLGSASDLHRPERKHEPSEQAAKDQDGAAGPDGDPGAGHATTNAGIAQLQDPWADEPSLGNAPVQATQPAESEAEPHHHKHVAVPDADDQVDPWAEQAQEFQSRPLQGFSQPQSRAQESAASRGPVTSREPVTSRGPVAGGVSSHPQMGTPAQAQDSVSGGISLQGFTGSDASQGQGSVQVPQAAQQAMPQSSQPVGDRAFQPQQDAGGSVGSEDDEYSLDDADISEGMSIEEIAKSFDAKEVRDITEDGNGAV